MVFSLIHLGLLIILAISNSALFAQEAQHTENSADQTSRSTGRVNPSSFGMEMSIPIGTYPGRGISIPVSISYSSKVWRMEYDGMEMIGGTPNDQGCFSKNVPKYSENSASGWTSSMGIAYVEYTGEDNRFNGDGHPRNSDFCADNLHPNYGYIKRIQIHLPSGESHELRASDTPITYPKTTLPEPINMSGTYYSVDGSNLKYIEGSRRLYLPNGSYYDFSSSKSTLNNKTIRKATKYRDVNGNQVTYYEPTVAYPNGYWVDTLGKTIPVPLPLSSPTSPDVVDYNMPGIGGTSRTYKLHWKLLKDTTAAESGLTNFNQTLRHVGDHSGLPEGEYSPTGLSLFHSESKDKAIARQSDPLFNPVVLTAVELPNGQIYKFSYSIYGEIEHIDYPTGSEENITYGEVPAVSSFISNATILSKEGNRGVTQRKVYESNGATPYTWAYSSASSYVGTTHIMTRTIVAPDGTKSETDYHKGDPPCSGCYYGSWGFTNILTGKALETRSFASNNQIMSKTKTTWDKTEFNLVIGDVDAQWHPRVTKVESIIYDLSGNYLSSTTTTDYAGNLNEIDNHLDVSLVKNYGYTTVIGGLGTLEKQIETTVMEYDSSITWSNYESKHIIGLPTKAVIKDGNNNIVSQAEIKYDESGYSGGTYRGQPTRTRNWLNLGNTWIETRTKYDTHGNVIETEDGNGNISKIEYNDNYSDNINRNSKALPTKTISAIPGGNGSTTALITTTEYDFDTGLPVETTDAKGQTTQLEYNDSLLRPTKKVAPNGHQTITEYGVPDSSGTLPANERFIKAKTQIDANNWNEGYKWFDGFGRTIKTESKNNDGDIFTETLYDSVGRIEKVSNPYRTGETPVWTTNYYDVAGRVEKVKTPDNSEVLTSYSIATIGSQKGNVIVTTDQMGKQRRSITNAFGQLKRIDEPTSSGLGTISSPNQATTYDYDTLNNLVQVNQGVQTRAFQYNSLSRLTQATNPESGTITYNYDSNGNLTSKTDARNITTTYTYDALNRVKTRTYSDTVTPDVTYYYDNLPNAKGQLIKVVTGDTANPFSVTEYTSFDIMGRVLSHKQTTDGENYTTNYTYNLSGGLIEQTYPSGRVVKNVLDNDGEMAVVKSKKDGSSGYWDYANSFTYNVTGVVKEMQLGNGKWESTQFNERLQPTQIALGKTQNSTDLLKLDYEYKTAGQNDNNGNVLKQTITVPTVGSNNGFTAVQTYTYDELNRIKDAKEMLGSTEVWKQTFTYDRYGNRNFDEANTTTLTKNCGTSPNLTVCSIDRKSENPSISANDNRIIKDQDGDQVDDFDFDLAGNTEKDPDGRTFIYDGENKQIEVKDASNNIIGEYFYDASGKMIGEYSTQVESVSTAQVSYLTNDHLGSPRITTDKDGDVYSRRDFMPFGEEVYSSQRTSELNYKTDKVRQKFTGYERDDETELDFAQARMHNYNLGRFTSPDPVIIERKRLVDA